MLAGFHRSGKGQVQTPRRTRSEWDHRAVTRRNVVPSESSPLTTEVRLHVGKMLGLALLILAIAVLMAVALVLTAETGGSRRRFGAWIAVVGFAAVALAVLWQAVRARYPVVVLTPDGLHDIRLTRGPIAWRDVVGVSLSQVGRQRFVTIAVSQAGFTRTELTSQGGRLNAWTFDGGGAGLRIPTALLEIRSEDLLAAVARHISDTRGDSAGASAPDSASSR